MEVKITSDELAETLNKLMEDYTGAVTEIVNEQAKDIAEWSSDELKKGGPYRERTGKYTKDWDSKIREKRVSKLTGEVTYSVYNKKHYQLTHLLEKGHVKRNGSGRVRAFEHIAPVEKEAEERFIKGISEGIERL